MTARFLPVPGFEGFYEVSDGGDVRSVARAVAIQSKPGLTRKFQSKAISKITNESGYVLATLCVDGRKKQFRVHRLVLMAFSPNALESNLDVNHINGIKSDNRLENLEWVTRSENHIHRYKVLKQKHSMTGKFGAKHHRSIRVCALNEKDEVVQSFDSLMDAQRAGYQASRISDCLNGKRSTHGGLRWKAPNLRGFV